MLSVYLETSIISYLAARPSRDLVVAARQQITRDWWTSRRHDFEYVVSELVCAECGAGDPDAVRRREDWLRDLPVLAVTDTAEELATQIVRAAGLPQRAQADALHIAVAAVHGVEFLVTWNSAHIANAELRPRVEAACRVFGYEPPVLCTPDELLGTEVDHG
jgi:predicted nucleic acid-binding protein